MGGFAWRAAEHEPSATSITAGAHYHAHVINQELKPSVQKIHLRLSLRITAQRVQMNARVLLVQKSLYIYTYTCTLHIVSAPVNYAPKDFKGDDIVVLTSSHRLPLLCSSGGGPGTITLKGISLCCTVCPGTIGGYGLICGGGAGAKGGGPLLFGLGAVRGPYGLG